MSPSTSAAATIVPHVGKDFVQHKFKDTFEDCQRLLHIILDTEELSLLIALKMVDI